MVDDSHLTSGIKSLKAKAPGASITIFELCVGISCSILFLGCTRVFHIKHNLAEGQVFDLAIIRKPTGLKSHGFLPVYEDYLEGYIRGGLFDFDAQPIQGVRVKVLTEKGEDAPEFTPGITDSMGIFKVRFSLPIRWKRVEFSGSFSPLNWKIVQPNPKFYIYFNRDTGVFVYSLKEAWLAVKSEQVQTSLTPKQVLPMPEKKSEKKKDFFEGFGFGP